MCLPHPPEHPRAWGHSCWCGACFAPPRGLPGTFFPEASSPARAGAGSSGCLQRFTLVHPGGLLLSLGGSRSPGHRPWASRAGPVLGLWPQGVALGGRVRGKALGAAREGGGPDSGRGDRRGPSPTRQSPQPSHPATALAVTRRWRGRRGRTACGPERVEIPRVGESRHRLSRTLEAACDGAVDSCRSRVRCKCAPIVRATVTAGCEAATRSEAGAGPGPGVWSSL